ncbi:MAG: hypothetical protein ACKPE3_31055, partial [Sphaerospermopsis kisseleviana]
MLNFPKFMALTVTSCSFAVVTLSTLSKPILAGEPIIDRNCRYHERTREVFQKISPENQGTVLLTSPFKVNNQKYTLQLLKFPNSRGVLCLWQGNPTLPQRLKGVSMIQDKVIEKIEQDPSQLATYIVTVRGEKGEDILRTGYRLN